VFGPAADAPKSRRLFGPRDVEAGLEKKFRAAIFVFVGPIEFRYCVSKRV